VSGWRVTRCSVVLAAAVAALLCLQVFPATGKGKKVAAKAAKAPAFYYEYEVVEGDTLYSIARKFNVSMNRVKRWNRKLVGKNDSVRAGTVLKIRAEVPIRVKRTAYYVVQKGDTLKKVARKTGSPVAEIRKVNGLKRDLIRPGQKLAYLVAMPEKPSESVGRSSSGSLVNGEKMPKGPGYTYGSRDNVYGTNETVTLLIEGLGRFRRKHPTAPLVVVGNLSRKNGGSFSPHKSHQSGRDVDLGYMHVRKVQPVTSMLTTDRSNMDPRTTWELMKIFLDTGKVKNFFIDYEIQGILYDFLKSAGYKQAYLKKLLQYPRGTGVTAIVKHVKGHHHHMHLRFVCPKKDARCED